MLKCSQIALFSPRRRHRLHYLHRRNNSLSSSLSHSHTLRSCCVYLCLYTRINVHVEWKIYYHHHHLTHPYTVFESFEAQTIYKKKDVHILIHPQIFEFSIHTNACNKEKN